MPAYFKSHQQERLFHALLQALARIGYSADLTARDYRFSDWFENSLPEREVPVALFGRTPFSYDSACFSVLLSNGRLGADLVNDFRALGAPFAFEVRPEAVTQWTVGATRHATTARGSFTLDQVSNVVNEHAADWSPAAMLRAKNIPLELGQRQLDFFDIGLLPALEQHIREKLDRLLKESLHAASKTMSKKLAANASDVFQLVFRVLAAKILHDREVPGFASLGIDQLDVVLERVAKHYGESLTPIGNVSARRAIAERLWSGLDFKNLSVEALAYIYENTLVDEVARKELGTHSTPAPIARYIVHRLDFERVPQDERRVLEPCSGHGIFLVASLQRLRELLSASSEPKERHRYFVKMLQGFEVDPFALEVSKLCLVLADFPNPNGWKLYTEDVFQSDRIIKDLAQARIVLCNPPFEDFSADERRKYASLKGVHKPAEVLQLVLDHASPEAMIGFVLPRQFIDGKAYRDIRRQIAERYQQIEVVSLPDGVFQNADQEAALLIAQFPRDSAKPVNFNFAQVTEKDRTQFLACQTVTRREIAPRSSDELAHAMSLPLFGEVWNRLQSNARLGDIAEVHRGVEWQPPFNEAKYVSTEPRSGFERGILKVTSDFFAFTAPKQPLYLSTREKDRRREAFNLPWHLPKVFANAATLSRGMWRIAAFADKRGLLGSQRFHAIWPHDANYLEIIEAVLSGPVANAYIVSHEGKRDIKKSTLLNVPLPRLDDQLVRAVSSLTGQFREHLTHRKQRSNDEEASGWTAQARTLLLSIDATILRAYDLPPRLEKNLLDAFNGEARRVPFDFKEYYSLDFRPQLPLWMTLSPEFQNRTANVLRNKLPKITDPELVFALSEVE